MLADWGVDRDVLTVHPDSAGAEHFGESVAVACFGRREHLANGVAVDDVGSRSGSLAG